MATLHRGNCYTHAESVRESEPGRDHPGGCAWCGQRRRVLYRYNFSRGWYCNQECWRSARW